MALSLTVRHDKFVKVVAGFKSFNSRLSAVVNVKKEGVEEQ